MSKEYIDKGSLYQKIAELEEIARMRYLDTPSDIPLCERHLVQMNELTSFKHLVADFPAADVVEVVHGEWIAEIERTGTYSHCSECRCRCAGYTPNYKYCPSCGAKMGGGKRENK